MRREQLASLVAAGIHYVQPGTESLSGRVLKLMDKGVTGCQNVRMLRDAESVSLGVVWNYLFGFPDETEEDYDSVIDQLPAIHHLAPPNGVTRVAIERFSPYFNRPELGFGDLRPAAHYAVIHDLSESELRDIAYVFDAAHQGISSTRAERLEKAIETWRHEFPQGRLTQCDLTDSIVLTNTRPGFAWRTLRIEEPWEMAAFRLLEQPVHVVPYAANQDLLRWVTHDDSPALVPAMLHGAAGRNCAADTATALRCWRERDEEEREWDGIYMGEGQYEDTAVRTVSDLGLGAEIGQWRLFSHLYPPRSLAGPDGDAILDQWRTTFHMNKCGYRRGTGFVEVTDLRQGKQRLDGAPVSDFRRQEREAFTTSGLVHQVGSLLWWLPSRISRWPVVG